MSAGADTRSAKVHLSGWGGHPRLPVRIWYPRNSEQLTQPAALKDLIARGEGRSYGDQSINDNGNVIQMAALNRQLAFDPASGLLQCEAGLTLADIQQHFIPEGWMLPVTPGTRFVQVGGAIAADVHGKNHHHSGAFSNRVEELTLLLPDGRQLNCSQLENRDLFQATAGGMGLTGIIIRATIRLKQIRTSSVLQQQRRVGSLAEMLEQLKTADKTSEYSVAWLDGTARGSKLGRGIVFSGNDAQLQDLSARARTEPLRLKQPSQIGIPWQLPSRTISRSVIQSFNNLYWKTHGDRELVLGLYPFFYPLDSVNNWNRVYGKAGFTQYQFVLPERSSETGVAAILEKVSRYGGSSLAVLKRMGAGNGLLSFPIPGITVALDFPLRPGLFDMLTELDDIVIQNGGRVYLAKDMRLKPERVREMYHDLPRWLEIRRECDPEGRLVSNLSQRLELN
jgi:decaprenylphospho-beta-D-ribofuranose 2-oxidase